jgi:dihydroorotate dehydrogenase
MINSLKFSASSNFSIPPIFLKISLSQSFPPSPAVVEAIAESSYIVGVSVVGSGLIANDAHRFPTLTTAGYDLSVSGEIIRDKAVEAVSNWYTLLKPFDKHIIASGGVACGKDGLNLIESGASMISIYSGYVCNGPQIARQIKTQLSVQLMNKGYFNLEETIGGKYLVSKRREIAMKRRKKF